jgi:hypothetical protein
MGNGLSGAGGRIPVMCRAGSGPDLMSPAAPVGFPAKSVAVVTI